MDEKSFAKKQQKLCPSKICMHTLLEYDIVLGKVLASLTIDTIPNIGIGNANVNGNNPRFAYP